MQPSRIGFLVLMTLVGVTTGALAAGDWSRARDTASEFSREYDSLRRLTPEETRRLVTAIFEADEEERARVASDVQSRAANLIEDEYDDLEQLKNKAITELDGVLSDSAFQSNHSEANSLKADVQRRWESVDRMTRSIRGANHPVVRFLLDEGIRAHQNRQGSSSYCDVSEFTMGAGRADCLYASSCMVIELKPDNSRAISKGRDQAQRYANELNSTAATRAKLVEKDSDFARCETYDFQVDCYKLYPEIDGETNEMKSTSASWRTDC